MTQSELKELTSLGAELEAAKAEIEALREQVKVLQSDANSWQSGYDKGRHDGARHRKSEVERLRQHKNEYMDAAEATRKALLAEIESFRNGLKNARYRIEQGRVWNGMGWTLTGLHAHQQQKALDEIDAALSHQGEPTDTYTAVDMATAAEQGFRDGQAAVEQATAQDERKTFEVEIPDISAIYDGRSFIPYRSLEAGERLMTVAQHLRIEKQLLAALTRPAQTAPQGKFRMGDLVKKSSGSEWVGHICGTYSTELTPEGYAVESAAHKGSVQIYPAKALEAVE